MALRRNRVLLASIAAWIALVERTNKAIKERKLQRCLLLGSLVSHLVLALAATRFLWGLHGMQIDKPLPAVMTTLFAEAGLLLSILASILQTVAHIINGGPLLPKCPCARVVIILLQMVLSLVVQGGSGAANSFQVLFTEQAPNVHNETTEQLLIFSWISATASTMYTIVTYLTTKLAEPKQDPKVLEGQCEENASVISLSSVVPRGFQSLFSVWAALTVLSAADYDIYAFQFLIYANYCLVLWNCLVYIPSLYSGWRWVPFPSLIHDIIWFGDLVMLSLIFRACCGAGSVTILIKFDLDQCSAVQTCSIFIVASGLTFGSYICILFPTIWTTIKRVFVSSSLKFSTYHIKRSYAN